MIEITGQMGRSINAITKKSSQTQLPGTIRKKNPGTGYSGTGSILSSISKGVLRAYNPDGSQETEVAQSLSGTIRKTVAPKLSDSEPISTNKKTETSPVVIPPSYESEGILSTFKSALTTYTPVLLIAAAVVLGVVIIKSAGSSSKGKGRR